jgi:uncharacterized protein YjbI with pentapeptide repeats
LVKSENIKKTLIIKGNNMNKEDLKEVIDNHKLWLSSDSKEGKRAVLVNMDLKKTDLSNVDLSRSDLSGSDLYGACLATTIIAGHRQL